MPDAARSFVDQLIRPFFVGMVIVVTAVQFCLHPGRLIAAPTAIALFVVVATIALAVFGWNRFPEWAHLPLLTAYAVTAGVLLALAGSTAAPVFAFLPAVVAGDRLPSRRWALAMAAGCSAVSLTAVWTVQCLHPDPASQEWVTALVTGLPVFAGLARRDRRNALLDAQRATEEAERAGQAEARAAALLERTRIAREIHDVLGHSLSGITMQLEMAEALRERGRGVDADAAVSRARALAAQSITETRHAIAALREDALPLEQTLRLLADSGLATFTVVGTPAAVPADVAHTVVRAAQEALTNAAKHAPAAARAITLAFADDTVALTVTNAAGANSVAAQTGSGMGLVGMRERAALLGGTVRAGPDPDSGGWTVHVEVPR